MWKILFRYSHTFHRNELRTCEILSVTDESRVEASKKLIDVLIKRNMFDRIIDTLIDPDAFEPAFLEIISFDKIIESDELICLNNNIMKTAQFKMYVDDKRSQIAAAQKQRRIAIDHLTRSVDMKEFERIKAKYDL